MDDNMEKFPKEKAKYSKINNIPLYELFHRNSELNSLNAYNFSNRGKETLLDKDFVKESSKNKSLYEDKAIIKLPEPNPKLTTLNIFDVIYKRRSVRNFSNEPITIEELSTILFYSSGVTGEYLETKDKTHINLFAYPSAGGLMPLDSYILIKNVIDIAQGIYYYDPIKNVLRLIKEKTDSNEFPQLTLLTKLGIKPAFVVYICGTMKFTGYKYGDRGYRFMNLEAGHLAQNLYLTSTAIGAGAVASGGFLDVEILELLGLNDNDNFVLYEIQIGKPNLTIDPRFLPEI